MPKYTFRCGSCKSTVEIFTTVGRSERECSSCGGSMYRLLPIVSKSEVTETVDKLTNRRWLDEHTSVIRDRKDIFFWKNEVPRLVNSGTYSLQTMLENNWVYYDDKGQLQTRTKPPRSE